LAARVIGAWEGLRTLLRRTNGYKRAVQHVSRKSRMAEIRTIGVIGAGQMGNGIAHVSALAGYDVVLTDMADASLAKGMATIEANMVRQISRDLITPDDMKKALARIHTSTDIK